MLTRDHHILPFLDHNPYNKKSKGSQRTAKQDKSQTDTQTDSITFHLISTRYQPWHPETSASLSTSVVR